MKRILGLTKTDDAKVGASSYLTALLKFISPDPGQTHLAYSLWCVTFLFFLISSWKYFFPSSSIYHSSKCPTNGLYPRS